MPSQRTEFNNDPFQGRPFYLIMLCIKELLKKNDSKNEARYKKGQAKKTHFFVWMNIIFFE